MGLKKTIGEGGKDVGPCSRSQVRRNILKKDIMKKYSEAMICAHNGRS
jgi:hypothetical protein